VRAGQAAGRKKPKKRKSSNASIGDHARGSLKKDERRRRKNGASQPDHWSSKGAKHRRENIRRKENLLVTASHIGVEEGVR